MPEITRNLKMGKSNYGAYFTTTKNKQPATLLGYNIHSDKIIKKEPTTKVVIMS
jgi:hypothetical protein